MTTPAGTVVDAWIPLPDGVFLAATLWLPDASAGPQACVVEPVATRKDDLAWGARHGVVRLHDEHGYAVVRVDLRGTGSSGGRATDAHPASEPGDLAEVVAWVAAQPWCDGRVGLQGTAYAATAVLRAACERPPALHGVVAFGGTDDVFEESYSGGALRLLDLLTRGHDSLTVNALPPVPSVFGAAWRDEWVARLTEHVPWLVATLDHQRADPRTWHGSVRPAYDRVQAPVLLVAGDRMRSTAFRLAEGLGDASAPHRVVVGPWDVAAVADVLPDVVAWWDRTLRDDVSAPEPPSAVWFAREFSAPSPEPGPPAGVWRADAWPSPRSRWTGAPLAPRPACAVRPDVGLAAWSAGAAQPGSAPTDQRHDDADSLLWDLAPTEVVEIAGAPRVRLAVAADAAVATVVVRLCDVAPDGTSVLVTRGTLALTRRRGPERSLALVPGEPVDVVVELDETAYRWQPGHVLRLAASGALWPDVLSVPRPVTLTVTGGELLLPLFDADGSLEPPAMPEIAAAPVDAGVVRRVERDALSRRTTALVGHGWVRDTEVGEVVARRSARASVSTRTFEQEAAADLGVRLSLHDDASGAPTVVSVRSVLELHAGERVLDVRLSLTALEGETVVAERSWERTIDRDGI